MLRIVTNLRAIGREITEYRELLYSLTRRDLILRYTQTLMGFAWAVFTPLMYMLIFTVVFTRVAPLETGLPYPIFAYAGLLPWNLTAASLRAATVSLTNNATLLTKVHFPREVLPISAVLVALVDTVVAATVLAGLMVFFRTGVSWTVIYLPVVLAVQLALTIGLALLLAMANLFYRDVRHVVDVAITVWMFATSVVYPVDRVGGTLGAVFALNPMTPIIDGYRAALLHGASPFTPAFGLAAVVSIGLLAAGWLAFHRAESRFAENV